MTARFQVAGPTLPTGAAVRPGVALKFWRERRGFTQQALAARLHVSEHAIKKWENGQRNGPPLQTWQAIASLLGVEVTDLIGSAAQGLDLERPRASGPVLAVRDALYGVRGAGVQSEEPHELAAAVDWLWQSWQQGGDQRFTLVGEQLPRVIGQVEASAEVATGLARKQVQRTANDLYRLVWAYLRARGAYDFALLAAEKSRAAAQETGDLGHIAAATWGNAAMLSTIQATDAAYEVLRIALTKLDGLLADASMQTWAVAGQMHLLMAIQAARLGRPTEEITALLAAARRIAERTEDSNAFYTAFGMPNVELHGMSVELELGRYKRAVTIGEHIDLFASPSAERRVAGSVQLAHCYLMAGQRRAAVTTLLQAVKESAEEARGLVLARETAWQLASKSAPAYAQDLAAVMQGLQLAS